MEVRLHVVQGKANVKEIVLGRDTYIGRGTECNLKIASSQVSRRHCRIQVKDQQVVVTDLGSANGTIVLGSPLVPNVPTIVDPGSEIEIGPLRFAIRFTPPQVVAPGLDDTARNLDTVRTGRVNPAAPSDADTVDYVPDQKRLKALRDALARNVDASASATVVAPGETVMDLNLADLAEPPEQETEAFPSPPLDAGRGEKTVQLPDSPAGSGAPAESDEDVVELPAADEESPASDDDDPALRAFLSDLGR